MKFRYKRLGAQVLRPIIPIDILHRGETIRFRVTFDYDAGEIELKPY